MKRIGLVLCATLVSSALLACAEGDDGNGGSGGDTSSCLDQDRDGEFAISPACVIGTDCNDRDANINTKAIEIPGNQVDENCDNIKATTPSDCTRAVDKDGDGYYDAALQGTANAPRDCKGPDCVDTDRNILPGGPGRRGEIANNGKDDDCDPNTPDDVPDCDDKDGDGWGVEGKNECPGRQAAEHALFDCNDNDKDVFPTAEEVCDGKDNDCDETGDGKGVDECLDAAGRVSEMHACGVERKVCLGKLKAPCQGNRDCDVEGGYLCHNSKCLLFGENAAERCFENDECVTNVCDAGSGKCQEYCEITQCGTQNVCGEPTDRICDNAKGCMDCLNSDNDGKCGCGLCAGFKCFDGPYFSNIADQDPEVEGSQTPLLQVLNTLLDCFGHKGDNDVALCTSYNTTGLTSAVTEAQIEDYICDDDAPGLAGDRQEAANDLAGCGLFNYDELEMRGPVSGGGFYTQCVWWDGGNVTVGNCEDYPADRN